jgi:hypothetical protein
MILKNICKKKNFEKKIREKNFKKKFFFSEKSRKIPKIYEIYHKNDKTYLRSAGPHRPRCIRNFSSSNPKYASLLFGGPGRNDFFSGIFRKFSENFPKFSEAYSDFFDHFYFYFLRIFKIKTIENPLKLVELNGIK